LGPNGLAVPVDPERAYELTTPDGVVRLALPAHTFDRSVVLIVTRLPFGAGGGPFATTLPQYGPVFRATTYPAAHLTSAAAFDFAAALAGDHAPPKAAVGHLMGLCGQTPAGGPGSSPVTGPVIADASAVLAGSPSYALPPDLVRPVDPDTGTRGGSGSG